MKQIQESFKNLLTEPVFKVFGILLMIGLILSIIYYASLFNRKISNSHTISGQIISVSSKQIVIKNRNSQITKILITDNTKIYLDPIYFSDKLEVDMFVLVTGTRDNSDVTTANYIQGIKPPRKVKT